MNYLVCIDDTDMPGTKGTGWLVEELCNIISTKGLADCSAISRHQLFVHEDIPYTSHNSSMCFELTLKNGTIDPVIELMANFLKTRAEKGSDPGLCVAGLTEDLDQNSLIEFGKNAKQNVSSKAAAYALAEKVGIHLSEHGGTGDGVVGAVAGIGLRIFGDDGRYRGWYHLGRPGDIVGVDELCKHPFIDQLVTRSGIVLPLDSQVHIGSEKTKTVRMGSRQVLIAVANENSDQTGIFYRTITKQEAKLY
ncbi:hypothetical protein [Desulfobacula phenolica]|uniref:tRNA(Ile2) 2-agmatinylcytidine synthetase n=1 Tax=Desulfobacula phenolica TaxID=90732 RepID=A0A1H2FGU0_9BACT|nr:hypothetical protein [Desulfobacula phenolica]SDU06600.1 hypothetical protein SAMN04487931_104151 [Desulfobacula phenolica]